MSSRLTNSEDRSARWPLSAAVALILASAVHDGASATPAAARGARRVGIDTRFGELVQEARNQYHAKKYAQAISLYSQALEMRPDPVNSAMLYNARGTAKMDAEDHSAAIADFDRALGLRPTETWTLNMAAWLRATSRDPAARDGKVAVQQATRACELTNWKDPDIVDTLAAAHAEAGDFERAVERQQQAIKIAPWPDRMRMHERLRLFQQRAPYRQKERRR